MNDRSGLIISFEREVGRTQSEFKTNFEGLISRIGGFIGVSKNFMWLMILIVSSVSFLMSQLKGNTII